MKRWFDPRQPQTLQTATVLAYLNGGFAVLGVLMTGLNRFDLAFIVTAIGMAMVANEVKAGYYLALASSGLLFLATAWIFLANPTGIFGLLSVIIYGALAALLVHRHSRDFVRLWLR